MSVTDEIRARGAQAPYLPFRTFKAFFERFEHLPLRVDRSLLRYTSGGNQTLLIQAFRTLGLTSEDGSPTPAMNDLWDGFKNDKKEPLQKLLRDRYRSVFELDLRRATSAQLNEKLTALGLNGDTTRKGAVFFLAALDEAGIEYSQHLKALASAPIRRSPSKPKEEKGRDGQPPPPPPPAGDSGGRLARLPVAVAGSLELLLKIGPDWTKEQRDQFMVMLGNAVDLSYPIKK